MRKGIVDSGVSFPCCDGAIAPGRLQSRRVVQTAATRMDRRPGRLTTTSLGGDDHGPVPHPAAKSGPSQNTRYCPS
jgi:hypothetical protein